MDDLDAACQRFDDFKVNWKKRLTDGRMKNVAFILVSYRKVSCRVLLTRAIGPRQLLD